MNTEYQLKSSLTIVNLVCLQKALQESYNSHVPVKQEILFSFEGKQKKHTRLANFFPQRPYTKEVHTHEKPQRQIDKKTCYADTDYSSFEMMILGDKCSRITSKRKLEPGDRINTAFLLEPTFPRGIDHRQDGERLRLYPRESKPKKEERLNTEINCILFGPNSINSKKVQKEERSSWSRKPEGFN